MALSNKMTLAQYRAYHADSDSYLIEMKTANRSMEPIVMSAHSVEEAMEVGKHLAQKFSYHDEQIEIIRASYYGPKGFGCKGYVPTT